MNKINESAQMLILKAAKSYSLWLSDYTVSRSAAVFVNRAEGYLSAACDMFSAREVKKVIETAEIYVPASVLNAAVNELLNQPTEQPGLELVEALSVRGPNKGTVIGTED